MEPSTGAAAVGNAQAIIWWNKMAKVSTDVKRVPSG